MKEFRKKTVGVRLHPAVLQVLRQIAKQSNTSLTQFFAFAIQNALGNRLAPDALVQSTYGAASQHDFERIARAIYELEEQLFPGCHV